MANKPPVLMAILNLTPDSFFDGGKFTDLDAALAQARHMVCEGADILDIGAESTRPGFEAITAEEELARLVPVLEALKGEVSIPISVDTYKAEVARVAIEAGASIINDVWGLQRDAAMAAVIAENNVKAIIMHNRFDGADANVDILDDMKRWFKTSLTLARQAGIRESDIILDPGIGFGKTFEQNLTVLAHLDQLKALGYPVLMGLSRKRFIGEILDTPVDQRLFGTLSANLASISQGIDIIRVHDIKAHREVIDVWMAIDARRT